jgi:NADH:ubiquinone oxidoreductase subunit 5 (subunit L)/multisubunit Na+/H+ antiporter MnhA subunit
MNEILLVSSLGLCGAGAIAAALYGLPAWNRRCSITQASWLLAAFPLAAFGLLIFLLPAIAESGSLVVSLPWIPSLGVSASLYFDHLAALFALLVSGIGALVVIYGGYYFKAERSAWRFQCYILLFMTAMLGVVMAGDVVTLFVFWEGTSITSYLLIGYNSRDEAARRAALKSLLITGGGGLVLFVGLLMVWGVTGDSDFAGILGSGELLRSSRLYPVMLLLIAVGAFTKSAQWPAHIWLPDAMTAPTPASAYLHSATMVKAGIYLMARLNPVLGLTELWFWLLSLFGLITMVHGACVALKQTDLKALLAYTTISQLGLLMMLIGQDTQIAFKALVVGVMAHALYKGALFMVAGIVDHETGTRDLQKLGGLVRAMPATFAIGLVAALSMAGLPPMFGFLAKETLLASVLHATVHPLVTVVLTTGAVLTGALMFTLAGTFVMEVFLGAPRDAARHGHEPATGILLAPFLPALVSVAIGLLPEPQALALLLAHAAENAFGQPVKVSLAIWTGIHPPLLLSMVAIGAGIVLLRFRAPVRAAVASVRARLSLNGAYSNFVRATDSLSNLATRAQHGRLRGYMELMLVSMAALLLVAGKLPWPASLPALRLYGEIEWLRAFMLLLTVISAAATLWLRSDLMAILALGVSGMGVAVLMALEPAPDLALVQIVVDILTMIVLVLLLTRLPAEQRQRASEFTFRQSWFGLVRDGLIGLGSAAVMTLICLSALISRPRVSVVTPFFEANSKPRIGADDIVSAILTDFRAFDTLMEIAVFCIAGLGVYTLLRFASLYAGDREEVSVVLRTRLFRTMGIGGARTSPLVEMLANALVPLAMVVGAAHMMFGHDRPGDGFTAGVIVSLAIGFWYVVFGYDPATRRLLWLKPAALIGSGLALALLGAALPLLLGRPFFSPVDFGSLLRLPLPAGFKLSTSFLFEVAICLSVLGSASFIIHTLGHPQIEIPGTPADQQPVGEQKRT